MKILIVQDRLRSGGTERQSILLANAFTAAGHATTLLTFRPGGALAASVDSGVQRRVLQPFDTRLDWFAPGLTRAVESFQPDVVLCMGRMANCHAQSIVKEVRARWPHTAVIGTMRTGKKLPWLYRFSLRQVRHVIANSREARANLISTLGLAPEKITVIYNSLVFPSVPVFSRVPSASSEASSKVEPRDRLRATYHAGPATTVLLNVAMFRPEKNQRELIALAAALPPALDWQLWLAGDGPERAACERLTAELNLTTRIRFLNFQSNPAPLYATADVAIHASTSESLSNFLIEAQAHGLPAVAYAAQGISECFIPGETGWAIPLGNRTAFLAALVPLFTQSASDRAARSARARTYARETFDPARQVAAYIDLFARLTDVR